jgi:hypothetical protein
MSSPLQMLSNLVILHPGPSSPTRDPGGRAFLYPAPALSTATICNQPPKASSHLQSFSPHIHHLHNILDLIRRALCLRLTAFALRHIFDCDTIADLGVILDLGADY